MGGGSERLVVQRIRGTVATRYWRHNCGGAEAGAGEYYAVWLSAGSGRGMFKDYRGELCAISRVLVMVEYEEGLFWVQLSPGIPLVARLPHCVIV